MEYGKYTVYNQASKHKFTMYLSMKALRRSKAGAFRGGQGESCQSSSIRMASSTSSAVPTFSPYLGW